MHAVVAFAHVHTLSLICWALLAGALGFVGWAAVAYARESSNRRANKALARYLAQQQARKE